MPTQPFTLNTLAKMDSGRNAERFQRAMGEIIRDVCDRHGDTSARKLTIVLTVKPAAGQEAVCDEVHTTCDFKTSIPAAKSKVYSMSTSANGIAFVNDASLDNIRQATLDQAIEGKVDTTTGEVLDTE